LLPRGFKPQERPPGHWWKPGSSARIPVVTSMALTMALMFPDPDALRAGEKADAKDPISHFHLRERQPAPPWRGPDRGVVEVANVLVPHLPV